MRLIKVRDLSRPRGVDPDQWELVLSRVGEVVIARVKLTRIVSTLCPDGRHRDLFEHVLHRDEAGCKTLVEVLTEVLEGEESEPWAPEGGWEPEERGGSWERDADWWRG